MRPGARGAYPAARRGPRARGPCPGSWDFRHGLLGLATLSLACGEGLPDVPLKLSKNCNDVELQVLVARVGDGEDQEILDVAADGTLGETAWVLLRRSAPAGDEVVVQRITNDGIEHETVLPFEGSSLLSLSPAPETGRVWVVRDEPGLLEVWRVAPDDPIRPLLSSDDLSSFPTDGLPCEGCEDDDSTARRLFFLPTGAALVALPHASEDAGLVVWVARLDTSGARIGIESEHRLNFEPPCDGSTPEAEAFCEQQRMNLSYPEISLLGLQQDPRQSATTLFGHRTRSQVYDDQTLSLESADIFMVSLFLDDEGIPAGVLRSYSGFYAGDELGPIVDPPPPLPTADPPYGVAIDRFAAYGLFSNGGQLARLVQLPESDPEFVELSGRVPLTLETSLLQLDRDIALGRLVDGAWELTKLFPDDPSQSGVLLHDSDASIVQVISGGVGTFMLRKQDAPPELVRVRCPDLDPNAVDQGR
jgi:hypothetical protein